MKKTVLSGLLTTAVVMTVASGVYASELNHTVKSGDTLNKIAKQYNTTVNEIKTENNLKNDTIKIGQVLKIKTTNNINNNTNTQTSEKKYTVKSGDTLNKIAKEYNTTVNSIKEKNNLKNDNIKVGQVLIIKEKTATTNNNTNNSGTNTNTTKNDKIYHTVKSGESLTAIAKKYSTTVPKLKEWNGLSKDTIYVGQKLEIKKGTEIVTNKPTEEIKENKKFDPKPSALKRVNPKTVKGIYISGALMNNKAKYNELIGLVNRTEINSVVMDVKLDSGDIVYQSKAPTAVKYSTGKNYVTDLDERMQKLKKDNIYTIARVVAFKDTKVSKQNKNWAIKRKDGTLYNDNGNNWLNPYNKETWVYIVDVAKEAASKGFDEIQFDYVRFPTNGAAMDKVVNYGTTNGKTKAQIIAEFLTYADKELEPFNVKVSADIFGIATGANGDSGIGHDWSTLTQAVDVMSPMMYPSHYGSGVYGIKNPNADPYNTIKKGLQEAIKKDNVLKQKGKKTATIRPWLQDFSQHGITYGSKQVKDQIKAAKELGVESYLLWNASNKYTEGALEKESKN